MNTTSNAATFRGVIKIRSKKVTKDTKDGRLSTQRPVATPALAHHGRQGRGGEVLRTGA
jgi:hypothetical protein